MAQDWFDSATSGASQPASSGGGVFIRNPWKAKDEARKDAAEERARAAEARADEAANRAARSEARADAAEKRAADKDAQDEKTRDARGGVDTTGEERKAAFLATRVAGGLRDLARLGNIGAPSLKDATIGSTLIGNYSTDEDRQRAINAQLDILDSALTLGTGAAYNKEQLEAYRQTYFPQPGDKPGTVEDKQRRLQTLMNAARIQAGAASNLIDSAISESGVFAGVPENGQRGLTPQDKDFLAKNARNLGEDGIRQFLGVRGLQDEKAIKDAMAYYASGGSEDAVVNWNDTPLSQGLSGINEGIASTLGAPVDIANAALGLGAEGINYLAGTDLQTAENPWLGGQWWRGQMTDAGAIGAESDRAGMPFLRRVGQSVGANIIPGLSTAKTGGQVAALLASSMGGGIGAATAREVAPGNVGAELAAELIGGGIPAAGSLMRARGAAQREIEAAVPTIDQLKQESSRLYREAEANGVTASPMQTEQLRDDVAAILAREGTISPVGRLSEVHPKVKEAYSTINDYASSPMNPTQMQTVRGIIGDAAGSAEPKERRVAQLLMESFDDWADPLAPQLPEARSVASRYINAEKLEKARELAEARASQFSGSGLENALRTEYRAIDRNMIKGKDRGPNQDVIDAILDVSRGTTGSNMARTVGKLAPTGAVSLGLGTVAPAGVATALLGPVGGGVTMAAMPIIGATGRKIAENMAIRGADVAELLARNGGALPTPQVLTPDLERLVAAGLMGQQSQYLEQ